MNFPILSFIIFFPLVGAFFLLFINREKENLIKSVALFVTLIIFIASLFLYFNFNSNLTQPQFKEYSKWLGYGINYYVGIDGISLFLVLLTTLLMPVTILFSWGSIKEKIKEYMIFMLMLETGILGVFLALNLFLFYVFWEAMLIPMYFLIGIWGGKRRIYATIKFVIYTMLGSFLMLVAIFVLYSVYYRATGVFSFDIFDYYNLILNPKLQTWLFLAFSLSFAIKVPIFPFHTWLPDAHVEAPTAGSVILAGVLLKMGIYGFLRFAFPLFPDALFKFMPILVILSIIGIIYGGLMALIQKDIKSLVAYSSVSHLGLIMLAILALKTEAVEGGIYQMINHGLSTGALFLIVGFLYDRAHTRMISDFGGVSKKMPIFSAFFIIVILSSIGFPGLNGFIGEFLCLIGIFKANKLWAILGTTTVILSVAYLLWMFQRVMQGPIKNERILKFKDLNLREIIVFVPILFLIFWLGIAPGTLLRKMDKSVDYLLKKVKKTEELFSSHQFLKKGEDNAFRK
jgi:NADH-quinone oxidoreductase subunit M